MQDNNFGYLFRKAPIVEILSRLYFSYSQPFQTTMKLITNHKEPKHLEVINNLLTTSNETVICVAFLKLSGLDNIIKRLKNKSTFYIGTDYYITEPSAIKKLLKAEHTVYLTKKSKSTFHPKIYYFSKGNKISILTGSANLTGGGLDTNFEVSILIETNKGSDLVKDFKSMIEDYSVNSTLILGELQISQYERDYEAYKKKHNKADKEFKAESESTHRLDLSQLEKLVKEYIDDGGQEIFEKRTEYYKTAKKLLNKLSKDEIKSANDFLYYYDDIAKAFHSSGLLRGKTIFAKKYKTIISIIKFIQQNKSSEPSFLFSKALSLVHKVERFGVNALTEIMNTYNPNKYSVANGRIIKSLSALGFPEFPEANNFNTDNYENYNNLMIEIAIACKFKDLGQVDHFLSSYYEKHLKK